MQVQVHASAGGSAGGLQVQVWHVIQTLLWHDRTRDIADLNQKTLELQNYELF